MRILAPLRARRDAAYDNAYHSKLQGRLWGALKDTDYDALHDENRPKPFTYSNPFPPGDMDEGDERTLLVASPYEDLLAHVADDLINFVTAHANGGTFVTHNAADFDKPPLYDLVDIDIVVTDSGDGSSRVRRRSVVLSSRSCLLVP